MLSTAHLVGSVVNSALAIIAAVMIYRAMHEGLTQEQSRAGIMMLVAFAVGRSVHAIGEAVGFPATEIVEYLVYAVGYLHFMGRLFGRRSGSRASAPAEIPRAKP